MTVLKRLKKLKCISAIVLKIKFHTISMTTIFHREICYVKNVNPPLFTSVMYRSRYSTDWSQNKGENRKTVLINKFTRYSCNRYIIFQVFCHHERTWKMVFFYVVNKKRICMHVFRWKSKIPEFVCLVNKAFKPCLPFTGTFTEILQG